jgi:hypothetical protein
MNTTFIFQDENREYKKADLIVAFSENNRKYVAYELESEKDYSYDVMHFALYDEVDGRVFIHQIEPSEKEYIKNKLIELLKGN